MEAIKLVRGKISGPAILVLFFAIGTPVHANVNIAPISVNFGNRTVGTSSAPVKMTLTNATKHKTWIVSISSSVAQFSYSWPSLPFTLNPGQKLTGSVTFTPAALQTYRGTLTFTVANGPSAVVSLTGTGVQAQPSAAIQPATEMVAAGQAASFSASTSGVTPLGYQWKKNGAAINGATSSAYTTPPTTTSDNGAQFTVTVSTSTGSASSNPATLTVIAAVVAPSITAQPVSQTVSAGQAATFSAAATGTAPLNYQWMKNGTPIAGAASSTYTTPVTTTADTGSQFTATVSNSAGTITSSAATLTVNAVPGQLTASASTLNFGSVNVGTSIGQSVTFTNAGNANITISSVIFSGAGFNVSGLSSGLILSAGQSATLNVSFAPAATGTVTGSVTIISNAANSPLKVNLSGAGVQPQITSITVTPANQTVPSGTQVQFKAADNFGNDITSSVAWSSSDPSIVSITADGLATGLVDGSVTIMAGK